MLTTYEAKALRRSSVASQLRFFGRERARETQARAHRSTPQLPVVVPDDSKALQLAQSEWRRARRFAERGAGGAGPDRRSGPDAITAWQIVDR